jgi:hypothetical protein
LKNIIIEQSFNQLMTETVNRQGWSIPARVQQYMIQILVDKIGQNPWQPQPSYAEQYMMAQSIEAIVALGNTCWFTRAVFPEIGARRGINSSYYTGLGQGCYTRVLAKIGPNNSIQQLRDHFDFLAEVAWTVIHSQGEFRSMWL